MEIKIDLTKSINENASDYFQKSKAAKKKTQRIEDALKITEKKLKEFQKQKSKSEKAVAAPVKKRKLEWFEKFHWFFSSNGFLVICGRDAKQNELVVKKYMDDSDLYFHAEIQGAAHCVVKSENKVVDPDTKKEAAQFAGVFSKAWQSSLQSIDVYSVKPDQVSKKAPSGESLGTGAFMIYGKREWFKRQPVQICIGVEKKEDNYRVISGPEKAVRKNAAAYVKIIQGKDKPGKMAKQIKKLFELKLKQTIHITLDEIIKMMPGGNCDLVKDKHFK